MLDALPNAKNAIPNDAKRGGWKKRKRSDAWRSRGRKARKLVKCKLLLSSFNTNQQKIITSSSSWHATTRALDSEQDRHRAEFAAKSQENRERRTFLL